MRLRSVISLEMQITHFTAPCASKTGLAVVM